MDSPVAGPSSSFGRLSTVTPPRTVNPRTSSRRVLRPASQQDVNDDPPLTPQSRRSQQKERQREEDSPQLERESTRSTRRPSPIRSDFMIPEDDLRHSHGLSWTSNTRDSVVDNILLALDSLPAQTTFDLPGRDDHSFDRERFRMPELPQLSTYETSRTDQRTRGHTHSSSASSAGRTAHRPPTFLDSPGSISSDLTTREPRASYARSPWRASSRAKPEKSVAPKPTSALSGQHPSTGMFDEQDDSESHRDDDGDDTDAGHDDSPRRAHEPITTAVRNSTVRKSMSLGHLFGERAAPSRSVLDTGGVSPSLHAPFDSTAEYSDDAAPEPVIAAGPRKQQNPTGTGPVYVGQIPRQGTIRKVTTHGDLKSANRASKVPPTPSIPQNVRDQASDFVRATSARGLTSGLPSPTAPIVPATPATEPRLGSRKGTQPSVATPATPRERPGFFKRVFGGVSRSASQSGDRDSTASATVTPEKSSMTAVRSKFQSEATAKDDENRPRLESQPLSKDRATPASTYAASTVSKKSSFFRRRKKSVSVIPDVPPLPIISTQLELKPPEPSPSISSLRRVMDDYLSKDLDFGEGLDVNPSTVVPPSASGRTSDELELFHSGYAPNTDSSLANLASLSTLQLSLGGSGDKAFEAGNQPANKLKVRKSRGPDEDIRPSRPRPLDLDLDRRPSAVSSASDDTTPQASPLLSYLSLDDKTLFRTVGHAETKLALEQRHRDTPGGIIMRDSAQGFDNADDIARPLSNDQAIAPRSNRSESQSNISAASEIATTRTHHPSLPGSGSLNTNVQRRTAVTTTTTTTTTDVDAMKSPASPLSSPSTPLPFYSASSLPLPSVQVEGNEIRKSTDIDGLHITGINPDESDEFTRRAQKIFDGDEEDVSQQDAASWLGERNPLSTHTLNAYMRLFDFAGLDLLTSLRALCGKLLLRGETQQFDRIIQALSSRWCESNPAHGFKTEDVVHTIFYSLILLNTDLHLADIGEKMSRSAYVKNTVPTIRRLISDHADDTIRGPPTQPSHPRPAIPWMNDSTTTSSTATSTRDASSEPPSTLEPNTPTLSKRLSMRPTMLRGDSETTTPDVSANGSTNNLLIGGPWQGSMRSWEVEIEAALKTFYASIRADPLPLLAPPLTNGGLGVEKSPSTANLHAHGNHQLRRTGSTISRTPSENPSHRSVTGLRSMTMGWQGRNNRARPKVYPASTYASSRTSFDDTNSIWSPAQSSSLSKTSYPRTLTSASMGSLHFASGAADFKHSIGFANALSQAIIREEGQGAADSETTTSIPGGLLEDEALSLEGAPWAKEGLVKHKHHLESHDQRAKERSWTDCFAVIGKGKLTLFAFNTSSSKSQSIGRRTMAKNSSRAASMTATTVGGGDWMGNAEQLDSFILRQTIASTLPPPGYSKTRPHVWALSLPSGGVHLFQVGTPEIAKEFMTTANYWSARLSKEPLSGGVSNIEYGWSDAVINLAVLDRAESNHSNSQPDRLRSAPRVASPTPAPPPPSIRNSSRNHMRSRSGSLSLSRPSLQSSLRTSIDNPFGTSKTRLPGDRVQIAEWLPPSQSLMASQLLEVDQLKALTAYVRSMEEDLATHNELKHAIELAYTPRQANHNRAMINWQRKSDYMLREIVKFQTYIDSLTAAQRDRDAYYQRRSLVGNARSDSIRSSTAR